MPRDRGPATESSGSIAIGLLEDNRVVREGLTALLSTVPGFRVVHTAAYADVASIQLAQPRVLLLDIGLENGDSLEMARDFAEDLPGCGIIVMDLLPSHEDIRDFVAAGVAGFILKDASVEELTETIKAVAGGAVVLPTSVTSALFSQIASHAIRKRGPEAADDVRLTARERDVLDQIADGLSNKAIVSSAHLDAHGEEPRAQHHGKADAPHAAAARILGAP